MLYLFSQYNESKPPTGCVYYEAIIDIKPNCELLIWYDDLLAKTLGILTLADIAKDSEF